MQDMEKNRVEYVARMEETVQHLKRQLDDAKPLADKWTPQVAVENTGDTVRFTLAFGGKRVTVGMPTAAFTTSDATTMTSSIVDAMIKNIVFDSLTPMVLPHVEQAIRNVSGIQSAGKW